MPIEEITGQNCQIAVRENGPYVVSGTFTMIDKDGNQYTLTKDTVALCRCGQSANKPFCDGTHKACGFLGASLAREHPTPEPTP
jgi:CDGSH-type Zn-finger protein